MLGRRPACLLGWCPACFNGARSVGLDVALHTWMVLCMLGWCPVSLDCARPICLDGVLYAWMVSCMLGWGPAYMLGWCPACLHGALRPWMAPSLYIWKVPCMLRICRRPYARPDPATHAKRRENRNAPPVTTLARIRYLRLIERVRYLLDHAAKKK